MTDPNQDVRQQFEAASDAYDLIDRYLRNNMGDADYAEYSEALDKCYQAALQSPAVRELVEALRESRRELHACQAVIHLHGGFDTAYVTGAQASLKRTDAALRTLGAGHVE